MNRLSKYVFLWGALSANVWATEPYQLNLPLKPSISMEVAQQTHGLAAADYDGVVNELSILSKNYWGAYQGKQTAPQCVLRIQSSEPYSFTPIELSFFNDHQGLIYIENPIDGTAGGVATGIPPQYIPNISRICQAYWQPAIKN